MAKNNPEVIFKKMKAYAATDGKTIYLDKAKNKGMQGLDSFLHEKNHINNPRMSERDIIEKTRKDRLSILGAI